LLLKLAAITAGGAGSLACRGDRTGGGVQDIVAPGTGLRTKEEGLGDVIAGITYRDLLGAEPTRALAADLTKKIKFGTADENPGLGTRETGYMIQMDVYKFIERWTLFGMVGYRFG